MSFDEQPDAPIHGECTAEIHRLEKQRDELLHALNSAVSQVKYLHDKFQETGSGNGFIAQWEALIAKCEQPK